MALEVEEWRRGQIRWPASEALVQHGSVVTRRRSGARLGGDVLRTRAVGSGKSGGSFRAALSVPLWRGCMAALPWPGGDWAPTCGPRRGKKETDKWDPAAEKSELKTLPK
jgi:hypothetical protein